MPRVLSILLAAGAVALAVALALPSFERSPALSPPRGGGVDAAPATSGAVADAAPEDAGELADLGSFDAAAPSALDGGPRALPARAPRVVRCGVVLVTFAGAQNAPPNARGRVEARALAERLAEQAARDFKAAVQAGDPGSHEDVGRIPRGVLEPELELALFSLEPGGVTPPVETPRGYWIAKRVE